MSPWLLAIFFDLGLYLVRRIWHDIPVYGGRARGEVRPRAPSLVERPDGRRRRTLSLAGIMGGATSGRVREGGLGLGGQDGTRSNESIDQGLLEDTARTSHGRKIR